jgi:hypothetical protein
MRTMKSEVLRRSLRLGGRRAWQLYRAAYALRCAADELGDGDIGETVLAQQLIEHAGRLDQRRRRLIRKG